MRIKVGKRYAFIDEEDYKKVSKYTWYEGTYPYSQPNRKTLLLHRLIMGNPRGKQIDHINRNEYDCRKENLRLATPSQNGANKNKKTGKYKGVSWRKDHKKWSVEIQKEKIKYFIGYFDDIREASRAYDKKARELFGEYARTNS